MLTRNPSAPVSNSLRSTEDTKKTDSATFVRCQSVPHNANCIDAEFCTQINEHDRHLPPAILKFWERSKSGGLSPRSQRISKLLPHLWHDRVSATEKLAEARRDIDETLRSSRRVSADSNKLLQHYFSLVPADKLSETIRDAFHTFDVNGDGFLQESEIFPAFAHMGLKEQETVELLQRFDNNHNGALEMAEFELMVREALNLPKNDDSPSKNRPELRECFSG